MLGPAASQTVAGSTLSFGRKRARAWILQHHAVLLDLAHDDAGFAAIVFVTDAHCSISLISAGTFASLLILRFGAKIMRT
jgi:hypothetical protein